MNNSVTLALIVTSIFLTQPVAARAEGSSADLTLAFNAVRSNGSYREFIDTYTKAPHGCRMEGLTAEKISYMNGNHGDTEVILVIQRATCPGTDGRPASKPALVLSIDLWRKNTASVKPDSPFTVVQEVSVLKEAH